MASRPGVRFRFQARVNGGPPVPVGWDGLVYLEHLQAHNRLRVSLPDGQACSLVFDLDPQAEELAQLGPLPCR